MKTSCYLATTEKEKTEFESSSGNIGLKNTCTHHSHVAFL